MGYGSMGYGKGIEVCDMEVRGICGQALISRPGICKYGIWKYGYGSTRYGSMGYGKGIEVWDMEVWDMERV